MHEPCPIDGCCCPAGQFVHTVAAAPEYWPATQFSQVLETESCWYLPTSQLMQELDEVCPVKGWYLPTPQAGQSPAELWLFAFCPPSGL